VTVGKVKNQDDFHHAISSLLPNNACFEEIIDKVHVEQIDDNDNSISEYCRCTR
jgi:hypothetical protein